MHSKLSTVVVVFTAAFAIEIDGSHARAASLVNRLSAEFDDVVVYSHENHHQFPWTEHAKEAFRRRWPGVTLVTEPYTRSLGRAASLKNFAISLFPRKAAQLLRMRVPKATPLFDELKTRAGAFVVSYKYALSQLNGVDTSRCVVDTHDILSLKWAKLEDASPISTNVLRKLRGEIAALDATSGVVAISPTEATFFRMMLSKVPTFYVSSWDRPKAEMAVSPKTNRDFDFVFVASGYVMNARGFCAMLAQDGEWLSRYRIAVCGRICDDRDVIAAVAPFPSIELLGFVEKIEEVYARSKAALVPVDGTGLKMKLISALASGLPAFASTQAFEGLPPGYDGAVFPINEATVRTVLDDDQNLAEARTSAIRYHAIFNASGESDAALSAIRSVLSLSSS
jgi:hypothetical protein